MSPWSALSKNGVTPIRPKDVRIIRGGQRWTASWHVEDGELMVWSAWGSRREPVARDADLGSRAQVLLGEIVDARS